MYSPSGVFQLHALQSPAAGRDHNRFNLNIRTAHSPCRPDNPPCCTEQNGTRQALFFTAGKA